MGKKAELSDSEWGMDVGARQSGLSFREVISCTTTFNIYRDQSEKEKISGKQQFCG